jgi:hypothetical protein
MSAFGLSGVLSRRSQTRLCASGFQRAQLGDHLVPRLDGFGDRGGLVLAVQRNCGTELSTDRAGHAQDDFVTPIRSPTCAATHIGFGAAGAMSLSHNGKWMPCRRTSARVYELGLIPCSEPLRSS